MTIDEWRLRLFLEFRFFFFGFPWTPVLLTLPLGYAVFWQGGVWSEDLNLCLLGLGMLVVFLALTFLPPLSGAALDAWLACPLLLLPGYVALQLLPLPVAWLRNLSPARAELQAGFAQLVPAHRLVPLTVYPGETSQKLLLVLGCVLIFLLIREAARKMQEKPWVLAAPILLIAGLEAALGLAQSALGESGAIANGTFVNRNHFAGCLEMALPFAVMYPVAILFQSATRDGFRGPSVFKACIALTLATVVFLGIIYSLSRMGFLAALFSLFIMGAAGLGGGISRRKRWIAVGLVGLLILWVFVFLPPDQLILRFAELGASEEITANDRLLMWKDTTHLIAAYPLFGCGLGGLESAFPKYGASSLNATVDFAHNDYLQSLAELGVIGFLILATLLLVILFKVLQAALKPESANGRCLALACTGSIAAILLHSVVDFNLYIPANAMQLAWISGIAAGLEFSRSAAESNPA